ncbi:TetR/AcrR family transcriptional regulator [Limnobacter humi]|uniref:TetR/AcrR family transcriptional regulator n=1 Tax=Limnobacter humi TaxID=1778671 RepID=A0ABT1WG11_9BURK|nr:TetR/AcrR family transcriptional regulator [Limnobacter humi]MCQ8896460.1 TetR/AcrR family transcriptional regulator [Limnobacter humi]
MSAQLDRKTSDKAELRRQQILDAAAECFKKRGFHGASMADISKSFGMSCGHIYNYFESKEAIIEAMVARDLEHTLDRLATLSEEKDLLKALLLRTDEGVQRRMVNSGMDAEILAEAGRNPKVAQTVQETDREIRERLATLVEHIHHTAGSPIDPDAVRAKTTLLMAIFDGLMIRAIRDPEVVKQNLGPTVRLMIQNLLAG